jgi:hypothetical protein
VKRSAKHALWILCPPIHHHHLALNIPSTAQPTLGHGTFRGWFIILVRCLSARKMACGPFVDEGDGRAKRHPFLLDEPSAGHKGDRWMTCTHGLGGPCYWGARTASEDRATVGKKAGRYTQGGASLCPGLSHHAPLGRRKRKTRRQSLSTAL